MGTPKRKGIEEEVALRSPTIAEKLWLLEVGKIAGKGMKLEMLADVLECTKSILLPVVQQLAKPLVSNFGFAHGFPKEFHKKRVVQLFESSRFSIWLERTGKWLIRYYDDDNGGERKYRMVNSHQLARIIKQKAHKLLLEFQPVDFVGETEFLKEIVVYYELFINIPNDFIEAASKLLEEREKRLHIMREWLLTANDFIQSLDPLASRRDTLEMPDWSIYRDHERGTSNEATDYLCRQALEPFWALIKEQHRNASEYRGIDGSRPVNSLKSFLDRVRRMFEGISEANEDHNVSASSVFGRISYRLPLIKEEWRVLREITDKIKGIKTPTTISQADLTTA